MKHFFIILILAIIFSTSAFSGESDKSVKSKQVTEVEAKGDQDMFILASMTCDDVFDLFDAASSDNKEMKPEDVMAAQDDVFDLITWVHGYLSGRDGIKAHKNELNKAGLEKTLANIVSVCKADEAKAFLDVVPNIK